MRFVARRLESIPCPGECKGNWATVAIWLTATRTGAFGRSTTRGRSKVVLAHHKCPPSRPYPTDMRANGRDRVESIPMPCPLGCNPRAPCPIADSGRDPRHPSSMETPENPVGNPPLFPPPPFREFMLSDRKRRSIFSAAKPSPLEKQPGFASVSVGRRAGGEWQEQVGLRSERARILGTVLGSVLNLSNSDRHPFSEKLFHALRRRA
jgi:hypothetical protein